jgi:type I restriction enzyme S subunit
LLTRGIDSNSELRPPQSQAPHLYKDSPLGWIPREWEIRTLAKCSAKISDRDHTTPVYLHDGVLMVSPVNLYDEEGIDFGNAKRISHRAHFVNRKKTDLQAGDLIIHRIGAGLGRVRLITAQMPVFSILHSMAQIRPSAPTMSAEFMLWALRDNRVQLQIELGTQSIGVPDLGLDKIGGLLVVVPALVEQAAIASVLSAHQSTVETSRAELNKLRTLKSGLMDDLLTGRVRVTPLLT